MHHLKINRNLFSTPPNKYFSPKFTQNKPNVNLTNHLYTNNFDRDTSPQFEKKRNTTEGDEISSWDNSFDKFQNLSKLDQSYYNTTNIIQNPINFQDDEGKIDKNLIQHTKKLEFQKVLDQQILEKIMKKRVK